MKIKQSVLWGIVLIIIGIILGGKFLGFFDFDIFFDGWWTLFIIVPCVIGLITENDKIENGIGVAIGIILLLASRDLINYELALKLVVPVILVLIGLRLVFKDAFKNDSNFENKRIESAENKENSKNRVESKETKKRFISVFSEDNIDYSGVKFEGAKCISVFGGINCDLRNAKIIDGQVINIVSVFGGTDIYLPEDVNVKIKSTSFFGGTDDKRAMKSDENTNAPTIYINSICIFAGVDIM